MPDESNQKSQYLKREEVRTMEKDIARLREQEFETAREKIAQLRTEEEAVKEAEKLEQLKAAAEERERMEEAARKQEEGLKGIKLERETAAVESESAIVAKKEQERDELRIKLKTAQLREEEQRRKFLEKIEAKTEGSTEGRGWPTPPSLPAEVPPKLDEGEALPADLPTPEPIIPPAPKKPFQFPKPKLPSIPRVPMPKIQGYFPKGLSILEKIWIRVIISIFVVAVLATVATFWYWYLAIRPQALAPEPPPAPAPAPEPITKEELKITQKFLSAGYHFPSSPRVVDTIIIHSGFNAPDSDPYNLESIIQQYQIAKVATHYLIGRDGAVYQLAPDYAVAYHAGVGVMPDGRGGINNFSLGISLVYQESESPNDAQYQSLARLIENLQEKYNIPQENILGYKDVAGGKTTPWNFDWDKLKLLLSFAPISPPLVRGGTEFILDNLTLDQKIGQLFIIGFEGTVMTPALENLIRTARPGGVLLFKKNIVGPSQIKELLKAFQKISWKETGLPLFVAIDQEGGAVSRIDFAQEKTGQPEVKTANQAYEVGLIRGRELKELGVNLNLAPVLDATQPTDFLHERSFQKTPEEIGSLAEAMVLGQKTAGILTAIKHFPGYGGIVPNPEENLNILAHMPQISQFQKAMEANPALIMVASVIYPIIEDNLPFALSKNGIAFLKNKLGDSSLIMTDDLSQGIFSKNFSLEERVVMPLTAGVDILLFSSWDTRISGIAKNVPEELIDKVVLKIIKLKQDVCLNGCG